MSKVREKNIKTFLGIFFFVFLFFFFFFKQTSAQEKPFQIPADLKQFIISSDQVYFKVTSTKKKADLQAMPGELKVRYCSDIDLKQNCNSVDLSAKDFIETDKETSANVKISGLKKNTTYYVAITQELSTETGTKIVLQSNVVQFKTKEETCEVTNASFDPGGDLGNDWFVEQPRPRFSLTIETKNCRNKEIYLQLEGPLGTVDVYQDQAVGGTIREIDIVLPPDSDKAVLDFEAGEDECISLFGSSTWECFIWAEIYEAKGIFSFDKLLYTTAPLATLYKGSFQGPLSIEPLAKNWVFLLKPVIEQTIKIANKDKYMLYECDGVCTVNPIYKTLVVSVKEAIIGHNFAKLKTTARNTITEPQSLKLSYGKDNYAENILPGVTTIPAKNTSDFEKEITGLLPDTHYRYMYYRGQPDPLTADYLNSFTTTKEEGQVITLVGGGGTPAASTVYTLLAPLPGFDTTFDTGKEGALADFLSKFFTLLVIIAGLLAVIMLVIAGIQYTLEESVFEKGEAKKRLTNAILGLLLVLGSYMILNTINPDLISLRFALKGVTITADDKEAVQAAKESGAFSDRKDYQLAGTYENPKPSAGVDDFVNKLKNGYKIEQIVVSASSASKTVQFIAKKGSDQATVTVAANIGAKGVSPFDTEVIGDYKTPLGEWKIIDLIKISKNTNDAILNSEGLNMGAAAWYINARDSVTKKPRGIAFHGQRNNGLGTTAGCIKLKNDDLLALSPYIYEGLSVKIQ